MSKAVEKASVNAPFVKSKERLTNVEAPPESVNVTFIADPLLIHLQKNPARDTRSFCLIYK